MQRWEKFFFYQLQYCLFASERHCLHPSRHLYLSRFFNTIYICAHISRFPFLYLSLRTHTACDALQFIFFPCEANPRHPLISSVFQNTYIIFRGGGGVRVTLHLQGGAPWRIIGQAVHILSAFHTAVTIASIYIGLQLF